MPLDEINIFSEKKIRPDMIRTDGTTKSAYGFLGPITNATGQTMTELSIGVEIDGKETLIPSIVPTLTSEEIQILRTMKGGEGNKLPQSIIEKAVQHARERMQAGKNPFYQDDEESISNQAQNLLDDINIFKY
jgi:hypothetical protein